MEGSSRSRPELTHEIIEAAHRNLRPEIWNYLVGGSESETTLKRNRHALESLALRPRVLRDVSRIDPSIDFLAAHSSLPVVLAPVGSLDSFWPDGASETLRAAAACDIPMFVSSSIPKSIEVGPTGKGCKVFQIFARGDSGWVEDQVRRAVDLGYGAICITVDTALPARRERDIAGRFEKPWSKAAKGVSYQASFDWDQLNRLVELRTCKVIVKGITTAEDALLSCETGVDAIYVSNHGGRQLDCGQGSTRAAVEVIAAIAGRAKVIVDGGVSRGSDVVKLMALGASSVGIGRLYLYGLAAAGAEGVQRILDILKSEIVICLGLLGLRSFAEINKTYVEGAQALSCSHVHSAFPLLKL